MIEFDNTSIVYLIISLTLLTLSYFVKKDTYSNSGKNKNTGEINKTSNINSDNGDLSLPIKQKIRLG